MNSLETETLVEAALRILNTPDPFEKARLGDWVASQWLRGSISRAYDPELDLPVPERPARLANVLIHGGFCLSTTCLTKSLNEPIFFVLPLNRLSWWHLV